MALSAAQKKANKLRLTAIHVEAKKIWDAGKVKTYADAVKKGSAILKKQGKL